MVYARGKQREEVCMTLAMILETNPHPQVSASSSLIAQFFWSCLQASHHGGGEGKGTQESIVHSFLLGEALLKDPQGKATMTTLMPRLVHFLLKSIHSTEADRESFYNRGKLKAAEEEDPHLNIWGLNPNTLRKKCASLLDLAAGK